MTQPFVHLQVHSEYSVADGIVRIKALAKACRARGLPAVALTDRGNLFALVKFYQACLGEGVKPIVGTELRFRTSADSVGRCVLLAMNAQGYANLRRLVSLSYTGGEHHGEVPRDALKSLNDGLIMLCGGRHGEIGQALMAGGIEEGARFADEWASAFRDRLYLEIQRTGRPGDETHLREALVLADRMSLPVVATNEVCFLDADDFEAHETRVCIQESRVLNDARRPRNYSNEQYLKSAEEMAQRFADLPQALENSWQIAKRCNVRLALGDYYLPQYPVPEGENLESHLARLSLEGLKERLATLGERAAASEESYRERLDYELGIINQMGFPGYFLIVMEFIAWAREQDIPVGPGRGSGAGSLVAYCLGITDLDPLGYDLLFERFLNPERVSMPDFDVDFCMEGRDKVINHVSERYGQDAVSQIITFGTMAAKAVVRDVARVQGKPYGLADKLSKLIPFEVGMTLHKAVEESAELVEFIDGNEEVVEIMEMAYKLEGVVRNVGRHAGGVVIAPSALTDFVPLYSEVQGGSLVSQFDKDDVERAGLVKFDFLGLKTLTIIDWCVKAVNEDLGADETPLDIDQIPLDDPGTFALLKSAETAAIFQLESRGMRDLIRRLLPDGIEDIIALVALFRPGPLQSGAVDDYINRKHGREPVAFPHPSLSEVLSGTYGVVLYQEQVMQIAQVLAGFSLGQADLLRRAMGKKKPEEMAKVREQFLAGTDANDVDHKLAGEIFDLMEKFAGYAFNKSHSATYALVSYQTAWLKTHYPAHFMAANLSADMQNIDKVVSLVDEVRRLKVPLTPPCVNASYFRFTAQDGGVVYGLGAVRGVGEGPVEAIVNEREQGGPFQSLHDFCQRMISKRLNKRVLEALIRSGAMDALSQEVGHLNARRAELLHAVPEAVQAAEQASRDVDLGMTDLFGGVAAEPQPRDHVSVPPWRDGERLEGEKDTLGLYLTGHPIDAYDKELRVMCPGRIVDLRADKRKQLVAGIIVSMRTMKSRRGGNIAFLVLDDKSARIEASVFADVYEKYRGKLTKDAVVVLEGEVQVDEYNGAGAVKLRVDEVMTFVEARKQHAQGVEITVSATCDRIGERLKGVISPHRVDADGCAISLLYSSAEAQARIGLGAQWQVRPTDELLHALQGEFGEQNVRLAYRNHAA